MRRLKYEIHNHAYAPVAAIRASRSAAVVHAILVPGESTNGRAAQLQRAHHGLAPRTEQLYVVFAYIKPVLQGNVTNLPLAHCAKSVPTHAFVPEVQGELGVNVANWALKGRSSNEHVAI